MPLAPGMRLGSYEVVTRIGAGGMGEVYRAHDTALHRDVALKVLPDVVASDPERLARFRREAQVLASLNHPGIGSIYRLEEDNGTALVLELVEGPTLAERMAAGPLPIDDALSIAGRVAEAVEAAHERNIIHRDLKPSNIKLRPDGTVKVLDFGLAKALHPTSSPDVSSPTITGLETERGLILGTVAYMSPEQARGQPVDKRTDIWAFGCVLYEMLAGKSAFAQDSVSDTVAAVLREEPDWSALPVAVPTPLRRLLRRCLAKDLKERLRDIGDARFEIVEAQTSSDADPTVAFAGPRRGRPRIAGAVSAVLAAALVALVVTSYLRRAPVDTRVYRASILLPHDTQDATQARALSAPSRFAISPDGRHLAFVARDPEQRTQLWVQSLDSATARPLAATENAAYPFWSPDSHFVAFFAADKLKRISVSGGPPVTLTDAPALLPGTWSRDDVILFTSASGQLYRLSASGGTPVPVTALDREAGDTAHVSPFFLPDGRRFLYLAVGSTTGGSNDPRAVYLASLDSAQPKLLLRGTSNAVYANRHLLFLRQDTLMAQAFDPSDLQLSGDAVPIAESIQTGRFMGSRGAFSVSQAGVLGYQTGSAEVRSQLAWFDRGGKRIRLLGEPADYGNLWLSPDGSRVAISVLDPMRLTRDIWLFDVARGLRTRITFDPADEENLMWSPDGRRVVFNSRRKGPHNLYLKPSSGTGAEEILLEDASSKSPTSWSPDDRFLLFYAPSPTAAQNDIWVLPLHGDRKPYPFLQTPFNEAQGRFSPDGRWVAYISAESGRAQVYVTPFPSASGKWQISTAGGTWPVWRRDGREIFYIAPDNKLMAAAVNGERSDFKVGAVRSLFATRWKTRGTPFDVTENGGRFLVNTLAEDSTTPITLVLNWPALLQK